MYGLRLPLRHHRAALAISLLALGSLSRTTLADDTTAPASSAPAPLPMPGMNGPLAFSANPLSVDGGPLGRIYISGIASGIGYSQDHVAPGDRDSRSDLSNGQLLIQKTDGLLQFYVQAGAYSLPALGTPYLPATDTTRELYGALPHYFIKLVPGDHFSLIAGCMPTLSGSEYTFSFENLNIERGLLWNQENAVNRGLQANTTAGPVAISVAWNDGFYSNRYNWLWGSFAFTLDSADTLTLVAGGNLGRTPYGSFATPELQNNGQIFNLIDTHSAGPWTVTPYLQYTRVPKDAGIGTVRAASTFGAALLARYAFTPTFTLTGRAEYIGSTGSVADGAPSLLYGPGSKAWSVTVTPTYQLKTFFLRAEASYVHAIDTTPGFALGPSLADRTQTRVVLETGFMF